MAKARPAMKVVMVPLHMPVPVSSDDTCETSGRGLRFSFRSVVSGGQSCTAAALSGAHIGLRLLSGVRVVIRWSYATTAGLLFVIGHDSGTFTEVSRGAGRTRGNGAQNRSRVL